MPANRFALALAGAASLALTACGDAGAPDGDGTSADASTASTEATASSPATVATPQSTTTGEAPTGTTAAASDVDTNPPGDACGASQVASFVSLEATPAVRAQVQSKVGHDRIRWLDPEAVITMDFRSDRLNVMLDKDGVITGAKCQ